MRIPSIVLAIVASMALSLSPGKASAGFDGPAVGLNIAGVTETYLLPYSDLMKTASQWLGDPLNRGSFTCDPNGWPTFSAYPENPNTHALQVVSFLGTGYWVPGNTRGTPPCPGGTYTVVYTPNAVCPPGSILLEPVGGAFSVAPLKTTKDSRGRIHATFNCRWLKPAEYTGSGLILVVNGSELGATPTDIRIYQPGINASNPPEFHPNYLAQIGIAKSIRTVVIWDLDAWKNPWDTPPDSARTFAAVEGREGIVGMSVPSFVRLVNQLGNVFEPCGVRINIPWGASDALIEYLAKEMRGLRWGADLRVEYGNECWNAANGNQWQHITAVGQAAPRYSDHAGDAFSGTCIESARVWNLFEKAYGGPVLKVISGQQATPWVCIYQMQYYIEQPTLTRPNRWSASWYCPVSTPPTTPGPYSMAQLIAAQQAVLSHTADGLRAHRYWLDNFSWNGVTTPFLGTKLDGYEGGFTHTYLTQALGPEQSAENLAVWAHPAMQGMMTSVLQELADPSLGIDLLEVYAADYRVANEGGVYPLYALYLSPMQMPASNRNLLGVLSAGKPGQVPLDTCGSPAALAIRNWNFWIFP